MKKVSFIIWLVCFIAVVWGTLPVGNIQYSAFAQEGKVQCSPKLIQWCSDVISLNVKPIPPQCCPCKPEWQKLCNEETTPGKQPEITPITPVEGGAIEKAPATTPEGNNNTSLTTTNPSSNPKAEGIGGTFGKDGVTQTKEGINLGGSLPPGETGNLSGANTPREPSKTQNIQTTIGNDGKTSSTYLGTSNLTESGVIEFWVKPTWSKEQQEAYPSSKVAEDTRTFFSTGSGTANGVDELPPGGPGLPDGILTPVVAKTPD